MKIALVHYSYPPVIGGVERVIEEQARGDKARSDALRKDILSLIGTDLSKLVPGSEDASKLDLLRVTGRSPEIGVR